MGYDKKFVDISQINKVDLLYRLWNQGNLKKSKSVKTKKTIAITVKINLFFISDISFL